MQRAKYTDEIEEDRELQSCRIYDMLPHNKFAMNVADPVLVLTLSSTTLDDFMKFCLRQQKAFSCYVYNSIRDGTVWHDQVLQPFLLQNPAFGPILVVDVGKNTMLRQFMASKSDKEYICSVFRGLFYSIEHQPFDLLRIMRSQSKGSGRDHHD